MYCVQGNKIVLIKSELGKQFDISGGHLNFIYTYIKQPQKFTDKNIKLSQQTNISVSYTHLDVYKRQVFIAQQTVSQGLQLAY